MSENNLLSVPEAGNRRQAARRARIERRQRALTEQKSNEPAVKEGKPLTPQDRGGGKENNPQPVDLLRPENFALPPRAQLDRRSTRFGYLVKLSFLVLVAAPALITALFYAFVASDQYATMSSFAVRGASSSSPSLDMGGLFSLGGMAAADEEVADSYILQEYIQSREMVEALITEANFLEIYSRPSADGYYRLDPEASIEDVTQYWQMMNHVFYDLETGILTMTIRAFRPSDAERITAKVIEKAEALVNELSRRAREDSVAAAQREVSIAEERFAESRTRLAENRATEREIDPTATATARATLVGELEGALAAKEAELTALRATMSDNAPRVQVTRNEIEALQRQIAVERLSVAVAEQGDTQPVLTDRLSQYEELLAEREFSQAAYVSALATLEQARMDALKQQRYLAVFVRGAAPEKSTYPEGVRWTLIVFGVLLALWGVGVLVGATVRDQLS